MLLIKNLGFVNPKQIKELKDFLKERDLDYEEV